MKCQSCGEENNHDKGFCQNCGKKLYGRQDQKNNKSNKYLVIAIVVLAIIAIAMVVAITAIVISKNNAKQTSVSLQENSAVETVQEETEDKETADNQAEENKAPAPAPEPEPAPKSNETQTSTAVSSGDTTTKYTMYVVNCKEFISLRPEPNVNTQAITTIKLGESCGFIEKSVNGFYKIAYNGKIGYALGQYLSTSKPQVTSSAASSAPETQKMYVVNCKEFITLRPTADVNSGEILRIPLGATVEYLGTASNGFYKIRYNGSVGYSLSQYLSTTR